MNAIGAELLRIGMNELAFAFSTARDIPADPEESVHQYRKSVKRLRALARLGRDRDLKAWRELDRKLRDTCRLLSQSRDATMLGRRAAELSGRGRVQIGIANAIPEDTLGQVLELLAQAQTLFKRFFSGIDWNLDLLLASLAAGATKSARDRQRFEKSDRPEHAHAWRKGVQRYRNQLSLVSGLMNRKIDARTTELDELADCLGGYHDFAVLRAALKSGLVRSDDSSGLAERARERQVALRKKALAIET